jgi:hypothetical protein
VRILLEECVHIGVKAALGHIVKSVTETYLPLFEQLRVAAESVQKGAIIQVVSQQTKR